MPRIHMSSYGTDNLSGQTVGQRVLGQVIADLPQPATPTVCYLDFSGVEVATASFLRTFVLGLRDFTRAQLPQIYPVVANPSANIIEDLQMALLARSDAVAVCQLSSDNEVSAARVLGSLEPKQAEALRCVAKLGNASAESLHQRLSTDRQASRTAWNNRLAGLAQKGLLLETLHGRSKSYRCVLPELIYG